MADRNRYRPGSGRNHQVYLPFETESRYEHRPQPRRRIVPAGVFALVCFLLMVGVLLRGVVTVGGNNRTIASLESTKRDLQNSIGNYEVRLTMQQDEDRIRDVAENTLGMVPVDQTAVRVLARDDNGTLTVYAGGEQ